MKVLIVKVSALGDVVHALPVLAHIRAVHPDAEIDWLVEEAFSPILEGHPLIQRVIRLRTKRWRKQPISSILKEVSNFIRELRSRRYDLVFDLQGNSKSGVCTLLARGQDKYGFDRANVREWPNLLATRHHVPLGEKDHHIAQRALAVVRAALPSENIVASAGPLHVEDASRQRIAEQLKQFNISGPLVVCVYGTTWQTKLWALESWKELVKRLYQEQGIRPVLTWGNEEEKEAVEAIAEASDETSIVWPRGSLQDLVALLEQSELVVGCDTGPVHIAAAVGTPTVSLYRVTDATRNGPVGEIHQRLQAPLECSPCLRKHCDDDAACSCSISVDDVYTAIVGQLKK
ncbi:heptosyltransferase-1 [Malonomonas rubra DSM 5091]|uniref:Lipopolysaccharide heptosyltransferase 1 n=1 Tax=Malonomonas rubra DSM 5091 TaxID=1122189 RepID=A0A1M6C7U3_MALRU|nr:lipopolysaccharide heptosyltransferase I [Malonomonas rubra]SHI57107.1 heptosyltransferase-1 [Malonomonas rubra DSM 5091]